MAEDAMKRDVALYHPYINFRDATWLKQAILYWDKIYRIAPRGYEALDPSRYWKRQAEDMRLLEGEEVVERCEVELGGDQSSLADLWRPFVLKYGDELVKYYRITDKTHPIVTRVGVAGRGYAPAPGRRRKGVGWLLAGKIDRSLFDAMAHRGLAIDDGQSAGDSGWFGFDVRVLDAYMTTLANSVIAAHPVETITDSPVHFRKFTQNSTEALRETLLLPLRPMKKAPAAAPDGSMVMSMAIKAVCPAGLQSLSFREVVAIRGETLGPREAFKASMKSAEADLRAMYASSLNGRLSNMDLNAVRAKHIDKPLEELRKAMRTPLADAVMSLILLKSPVESGTVGASALMAVHSSSAVFTGIGIAVGFASVVRAYMAQRAATAKSPLRWLLDVERKLGARETIEAVVASPLRPPG